jgi:hypothetical protein
VEIAHDEEGGDGALRVLAELFGLKAPVSNDHNEDSLHLPR